MYYRNFISESDAREAARKIKLYETKAELRSFSASNKQNIFLSHKHNEVELVQYIKSILEALNSKVYVDWEDISMPDRTTGETAKKLKNKIRTLDKFIFLASNGAINSKWCNWEVGYGDACKLDKDKFAIFPVNNQAGWEGSEYLSLYPRIEFTSTVNNMEFGNPNYGYYSVVYPNGERESLKTWLQK